MKILQLIQKPQLRGAEMFSSQLSEHLQEQDHQVVLVSLFKGSGSLPFSGKQIHLALQPKLRLFDIRGFKALAQIIKSEQPDIIQANAGDTLKYAVFSKLIFGWKAPIIFRNASEVGRYLNSIFQKRYNYFLYKKVDRVASVSAASEKDILRHFPFLKGRTEIIPIGLEEKKENLPVLLKPSSAKHIVHVGGFSFEKNHMGLLRIFSLILEKEHHVHLHLIGDGPLKKKIENEVRMRNLKCYVSFYGFVNNPLSFIEAADILVLPSIIEGLPGVILEAMYCKTAVVAYNVGGISEIVRDDTGILIEKNEEEKFSEAVVKSLEGNQSDRVDKAYKMVADQFMNKEIALKFVNSYRKIASE